MSFMEMEWMIATCLARSSSADGYDIRTAICLPWCGEVLILIIQLPYLCISNYLLVKILEQNE